MGIGLGHQPGQQAIYHQGQAEQQQGGEEEDFRQQAAPNFLFQFYIPPL